MPNPPTGTVTFLFTDIEGSTKLAQQYPETLPTVLARHHTLLRQAIESHRGFVFQIIGDAFHASFYTVTDAIDAAIDAQRLLEREPWAHGTMRVRMGINTGTARAGATEERAGGYEGYSTLARAERVMSAAHGGQILLSNSSAELARGERPGGTRLQDMGEHRLKGLLNPEHLWQLVAPDLPQEFPPLQSLNAIPNNLPIQLTSFVGREKELAEVKRLLATTRLLTLTGVGGTGKTRLSLQVAAEVVNEYPNGVWFVELAPLSDPALIPQQIASVVGLRDESGRSALATLEDYFGTRQTLLVLDNCEHVIDATARLADTLLRAGPHLKILATSRESLGIAGELSWSVPSLTLPESETMPSLETLTQFEATHLFVERARAVLPAFAVTDENAPFIVQICQRLDGIPLALELAAALVKGMSAEEIANHLDDRFQLLTGGSRTALPRQQTLRSAIDWSHQLLPDQERILFRRLSVFAGGWTLNAAQEICAGDGLDAREVLGSMLRLVDKSLLLVDEQKRETRYNFLETVRQYASEKLFETNETRGLRQRHCEWFVALAERVHASSSRHDKGDIFLQLDVEHDNLRAALNWVLVNKQAENGLRLGEALWQYWDQRGYFREGLQWIEQLLKMARAADPRLTARHANILLGAAILQSRPDEHLKTRLLAQEALSLARAEGNPLVAARALRILSTANLRLGNVSGAILEAQEGVQLARTTQDEKEIAQCLHTLGNAHALVTDLAHARQLYDEALFLFRAQENNAAAADVLASLGEVDYLEGKYAAASDRLHESLDLTRAQGNRHSAQIALRWLAHLARAQGDYPAAERYAQEELEWVRERGDRLCTGYLLAILGWTAHSSGETARGKTLLEESLRLAEQVGSPPRIALVHIRLGELALTEQDIARAEFHLNASADWSRRNGVRGFMVETIEGYARVALARQEMANAARLLAAAGAARQALNLPVAPVDQPEFDQAVATARGGLDESAFAQMWAEGASLNIEQAMEMARQ